MPVPLGSEEEITAFKNEVFLLPTRVIASGRDPEEDFSDVSEDEQVVDEDDVDRLITMEYTKTRQEAPTPISEESMAGLFESFDIFADQLGYDVDGRDRPDDALYDSIEEAANFSPFIICGEHHEVECIALWDFFGGNNFDDLNVHAGDTVFVVAEEHQVRVVEEQLYMRLPFQWSLGRWISSRTVNPYLGLIPSHYVVSKQFYEDHPLLFKWPVWFHGTAEVHEVVHKLYSDRSALCPGLFAIFSPAWLNINLEEHRCYLLMILKERNQKHDDQLKELLEIEKGNYGIMADSVNHMFGEMLPENVRDEKTVKMQHIEFISEIETTPFAPAVVPIQRSALGHYEFMGERYETLYDLVHHLATHRSALPHKLVYVRSAPLIVGRHAVPPPVRNFKKDLKSQPMIIEQWAAAHFDDVTRRVECNEKMLFATKAVFDGDKKLHERTAERLNFTTEEVEMMSAYAKKFVIPSTGKDTKTNKQWDAMPPYETAIRIKSPFYVDYKNIAWSSTQLGKGAFGSVNKGMWRKRSGAEVPVAVKRVEMVTSTQDERDAAFNELEILEMVSHPNVIAYYGFSFYNSNDQASIFLLFELMDHALDKFVDKCDAIWSENEKLDILSQICRGMSYLHTRTPSVVHGDLAARNVLLKKHPVYYKKFIAKITDLGLAKTCRDELYTKYDNPNKIPFKWCPPEVLASQILTPKSDVWMFGVLCFEVCDKTGEPYGIVGASNLPQYLNDGYRHDRGQHMSETIYDLALNCMRTEAADRPSFEELTERFLECIIEMDGDDEVFVRAREKVIAEKNRKDRMSNRNDKLMEEM